GAVLGQQEDDMGAEAEFGVGVLAVDRQQVVALSGGQGEHLRVSFIRRVWSGTVLSPDYTGPVTFPLVGNHLDDRTMPTVAEVGVEPTGTSPSDWRLCQFAYPAIACAELRAWVSNPALRAYEARPSTGPPAVEVA